MDFPFSLLTQKGRPSKERFFFFLAFFFATRQLTLKKDFHELSTPAPLYSPFINDFFGIIYDLRAESEIPPVFCAWDIDLIFYARFCDNGDGSTKDAVKVKDKEVQFSR